ncbi:MAG: hypothetical protein IH584_02805, partial [Candidatus Aminicenantes bacterium]|nr:hypothetical protein [Candidatus Aminicenantes bacterium]
DALFDGKGREAPPWCLVPLVVTAVASIVLFFYPQPFVALANMAAAYIFIGP